MAIGDLAAIKASFLGGHFRKEILDLLVDEIVVLDGRNEALDAKIDELDLKIDALEERVEALEG